MTETVLSDGLQAAVATALGVLPEKMPTPTFAAYRLPPFEVEMTHEDIIICDDDRCAHNSHPAGVTHYILRGVQIMDLEYDADCGCTTYTILLPNGERWLYMETWAGNPYPINSRWRNIETGETY